MALLHIINRSPFSHNSWESCLRLAQPGSSILLIEDGVYMGLKQSAIAQQIEVALINHPIYALDTDLALRGIQQQLLEAICIIDYVDFVKLVTQHHAVQNW